MEFTILQLTRNRIKFPDRCPFCIGPYFPMPHLHTGVGCLHCGRSSDVLYEFSVWKEQTTHKHHNYHSYGEWRADHDLVRKWATLHPKFKRIGLDHGGLR